MRFFKWLKRLFNSQIEPLPAKVYTLRLPKNHFTMCFADNRDEAIKIFKNRGFTFDIKDIELELEDARE